MIQKTEIWKNCFMIIVSGKAFYFERSFLIRQIHRKEEAEKAKRMEEKAERMETELRELKNLLKETVNKDSK